jgi:Fuc2NAc and GlcNAc transferase
VPLPRFTVLLITTAGVASYFATRWVLGYAAGRLVDVPNERSSHARPTPRGGGIAIVLSFAAGLAVLAAVGGVPGRLALALLPGVAVVAGVGWIDDHRPVPARWRSLLHFTAAAWALAWLGGMPWLAMGSWGLALGVAGWGVGALGVVWVINLYNFMDGIDGLAAGEAASAGAIAAGLLLLCEAPGLAAAALLLAACSAGFLAWNWHPARIFMGDVGSGTLGYVFAVLALASENARALPLLAWVVLLGVFVFDATVTLLRRVLHGERPHLAHRSHAYQRAARGTLSHAQVSARVLGLNLLLGLLVLGVVLHPRLLLPACAAALVALGGVYRAVERRMPMYSGAAIGAAPGTGKA